MISHPALALLKRELFTSLRGVKLPLFLVVLLATMMGLLVFTVENVIGTQRIAAGQIGTRDVQSLFLAFAIALYGGAVLLVPPLASAAICMEKQLETLDQLQTTLIHPLSLALAKMANILGIYGLVFVATLPFMGVSFFLVGIDWTQFVLSLTIIAASAVSCAAIGIVFSAWFYRTEFSITATYATVFLFHIGIVLVLAVLGETVLQGTWLGTAVNDPNSPLLAVLYPLFSLDLIRRGGMGISLLLAAVAYHGVIVASCLYLAVRILRRPARPKRINPEKPIDDPRALDARRKRFPYYLLDPRHRQPPIPDGKNPVYSREMQTGLAGRGIWRIRIAYGFGILCFLVSIYAIWSTLDRSPLLRSPYSSILIGTLLALVFVPPSLCFAMAREYESGNADMLRMTLLRPGEIAAGKFRAALSGIAPMLAGIFVGAFPMLFVGDDRIAGDLAAMLLVVLYTLALVAAVTAGARRSLNALLLGYGAPLVAHAAVPWGAPYVIEFAAPRYFSLPIDDSGAASFLSPYWARVYVNEAQRFGQLRYGMESYWPSHIVLFVLLTFFLLGIAYLRFQRHFNRS